jgi:hypothetical protein
MSARASATSDRLIVTVGLAFTALVVVTAFAAMNATPYDLGGAALIAPVLVLVSIPILLREARRQADPTVIRFLLVALVLKLTASLLRYYVDFHVYGGATDALGYHNAGIRWSEALSSGGLGNEGQGLTGTNFIELVTGVVYLVTRPTLLGGYVVFSWLGFWGLFLFYRAFVVAVPEGRSRTYARMLFFLPSLLFWPSGPGKEAWMLFTLGIAALGAANLLSGRTWPGLAGLTFGLWLASLARPHVAAILGVSIAAAGAVSVVWGRARSVSLSRRMVTLAVAAGISFVLVASTRSYFEASRVTTDGGVLSTLGEIEHRTAQGGSEFDPIVVDSPTLLPAAGVTVLFRPFVFEADTVQALGAAVEGTVLLLICLAKFRWALSAVGTVRRQPYVLFALMFTVLFIVAFSSIANFGILARERVQVLPLFLTPFAVAPWARSRSRPPVPIESTGRRAS